MKITICLCKKPFNTMNDMEELGTFETNIMPIPDDLIMVNDIMYMVTKRILSYENKTALVFVVIAK